MPQMAGDHGCGVKSRVKVVEPSQQQPEQVKTGLCAKPLGARCVLPGATAVFWEIREGTDGVRRAAGLCSSSLTTCSSHALPPQWLLRCSASPLKSLSSTHIHRSTTAPPPHTPSPARLLVHFLAGCCSLHAQPLIINMIPSRWSETILMMHLGTFSIASVNPNSSPADTDLTVLMEERYVVCRIYILPE